MSIVVLPDIKAGAILVDAPIAFATWSRKGEGRSPQNHYRCLSFDELAAIPMAGAAADDCFLFSWIPLRSAFLVKPLMRAWGFNFSGAAFAWAKLNPSGVGWFMGGGYGTRHNVEIRWLGRRGSPKRKSAGVRELIVAPRRQHSRKPDESHDRIEALCDGPYLEVFARARRPGWVCIGDQLDMFTNLPAGRPTADETATALAGGGCITRSE
jgi:N6-adenosine-specific RNA methylase IME4